MDTKKRIIDLTLGELMDAIDERIEVAAQKPEKPKAASRLSRYLFLMLLTCLVLVGTKIINL